MGSRRAAALLTIALLAGCGGDDDDAADTVRGETDTAVEQDAQAKANARQLATAVEACFVERQQYTSCTRPLGVGDVGDAEVETATATRFRIVSPSESGNEFRVILRSDGTIARECSEPGEGGCPASGEW